MLYHPPEFTTLQRLLRDLQLNENDHENVLKHFHGAESKRFQRDDFDTETVAVLAASVVPSALTVRFANTPQKVSNRNATYKREELNCLYIGTSSGRIITLIEKEKEVGDQGKENVLSNMNFSSHWRLLCEPVLLSNTIHAIKIVNVNSHAHSKIFHYIIVLGEGLLYALGAHCEGIDKLAEYKIDGRLMCTHQNMLAVSLYRKKKILVLALLLKPHAAFTNIREFSVSDSVVSIALLQNALLVEDSQAYTLFDLRSGNSMPVSVPIDTFCPNVSVVDGYFALPSSAQVLIFIDDRGEPALRSPVPYLQAAKLAFINSNTLVQLTDRVLLLCELATGKQLQSIPTDFNDTDTARDSDRPKSGQELVCTARNITFTSNSSIATLFAVSLEEQIDNLLARGLVEQARNLFDQIERNPFNRTDFEVKAALALLKIDDASAFDLFDSANIDPREVISCFQELHLPSMPYTSRLPTGYALYLRKVPTRLKQPLAQYLLKQRHVNDPEISIAVDSALLLLLADIESCNESSPRYDDLLFPANTCLLGDCAEALRLKSQFDALGALYFSKNQIELAITAWKQMGLPGVPRIINALRTLPDGPLFFETLVWSLENNLQLSMPLLLSGTAVFVSKDKALKLLCKYGDEVIEMYLQQRIESGDTDASTHTELAILYVKNILHAASNGHSLAKRIAEEHGAVGVRRRMLMKLLIANSVVDYVAVIKTMLSTDESLDFVNLEKHALVLVDELSVGFGALGMHNHVITLFLHHLDDINGAISYCLSCCHKKSDLSHDSRIIFTILLRNIFQNSKSRHSGKYNAVNECKQIDEGISPDEHTALNILKQFYGYIDAVDAINLLPEHSKLAVNMEWLENAIPIASRTRRQYQLVRSLHRTRDVSASRQSITLRKRAVMIDEGTRCFVCGSGFERPSSHALIPWPMLKKATMQSFVVIHTDCIAS